MTNLHIIKLNFRKKHLTYTCGRWVKARLALFLSDELNLNEFTKLIKTKTKQLKMTNDEFITFLVTVN